MSLPEIKEQFVPNPEFVSREVNHLVQHQILPWWKNLSTQNQVNQLFELMAKKEIKQLPISEMIEYPFTEELRNQLVESENIRPDPYNLIRHWYAQFFISQTEPKNLQLILDPGRATGLQPSERTSPIVTSLNGNTNTLELAQYHHPKVIVEFAEYIRNGTADVLLRTYVIDNTHGDPVEFDGGLYESLTVDKAQKLIDTTGTSPEKALKAVLSITRAERLAKPSDKNEPIRMWLSNLNRLTTVTSLDDIEG